ncbi:MAG: RusA family crossover junction endodeoxyribonuclease [Phycisphaerales bacterium]|nr:MAG: RusA family crossover junction endodeoxyribonuclease [Phycisphaerales bacterium]
MADRLEIVAPGMPVAQGRHRDRVVTPLGKPAFVQRYTPKETTRWRQAVLFAARTTSGYPADPWDGPVRITLDAYFERPKSMMSKRYPDGPIRRNSKPDADNLVKSVLDALTPPKVKRKGNAVIDEINRQAARRGYLWIDDGQVHLGRVDRWYAAKGCGPGVIIVAERIFEMAPDLGHEVLPCL